jgi:DNA polymerase-3 subunit delta
MTPDQFRRQAARQEPAPFYLFLGPEMYYRRSCRDALVERFLAPEEREEGLARLDLDELSLNEVIDDARSLSLFAPKRLIWVASAEAALPRGRAAAGGEEEVKDSGGAAALTDYARDPSPGVVLVFDSSRYEFEGEDKARNERVRKFYGAIPTVVEFRKPDEQEARMFAQERAQAAGLRLGPAEMALLVEATAGELARLVNEIDKLALYKAKGGVITAADIAALAPNAQETTVFALVNTLARGDRRASLDLLDTLIRNGEYLPLALTFVGGLLRQALAVKEQAGLRSARDVMDYFQRQGTVMWPARAEQVYQTAARLAQAKIEESLGRCFEADAAMKGARPDDRTIMEQFVFALTR